MSKLLVVVIIVIILIAAGVGVYFWLNMGGKNMLNNSSGTTIEGMKVEILREGTGDGAKTGDSITVNYAGTLTDGTEFDSSYKRNVPLTFTIGNENIIKGWNLGVAGMKVGEKRKLTIPPDLAYGTLGVGNLIPPSSTLIFEIELISVNQ